MANLTMNVRLEGRAAEVTVSEYWSKKYNVAAETHPCNVLGLFQYADGPDEMYPVFVVELQDGRTFETAVENVQFVENQPIFKRGDKVND